MFLLISEVANGTAVMALLSFHKSTEYEVEILKLRRRVAELEEKESDDESKVVSVLECDHFADRSRFVELPCRVGDTVYIALNGYGILKDTVKEFRITSRRIWIRPEEFGMDCLLENMAFLTREEAERALKERENNA